MSYLSAIIMGALQGVTEFLPISSSGHLAIFSKFFKINEPDSVFDILLHVGTLIAVFIVYWKDIVKLIAEGFGIIRDSFINTFRFASNTFSKKETKYIHVINSSYRKFVMLVIVSTIPTAIIGLLIENIIDVVKTDLLIVGICLLITACLLLISDMQTGGNKKPKNVTYSNAFVIGMCQGVATLPGISRSGTTITACLISGFDRKFAVKYSFIMSIPAILGAAVLSLKDFFADIGNCPYIGQYIVGMLVAAVVGFFSMKFLIVLIGNRKFKYFAYYCILAGIVSIVLKFAGI